MAPAATGTPPESDRMGEEMQPPECESGGCNSAPDRGGTRMTDITPGTTGSVQPHYQDESVTLHHGDSLAVLRTLPDQSVDCCVTSPPYFGLRDYGVEGQYGLEASPAEYVETMRALFAEVRRVLADDGTLWLNIGDSYSGRADASASVTRGRAREKVHASRPNTAATLGVKQLLGIPWRLAFALQDDGWILRSDIIWAKPNPNPEKVKDRPTQAHEYVFLMTKNRRYYYDWAAIAESATGTSERPQFARAKALASERGSQRNTSPRCAPWA